jgi:hypothetical protein
MYTPIQLIVNDTRVLFSLIISLFKELKAIESVEIGDSVLLRRLP